MSLERRAILFCTQTAYVGGGVEEWLWSLHGALRERGWAVHVALARGHRYHDAAAFARRYPFPLAHVLDGASGLREDRVVALERCFAALRPDVIVPVQLADALYAAARWTRRHRESRLVACLHTQEERSLADIVRVADDVEGVVSVSRRGAATLREAGIPPDLVAHIPTGVRRPMAEPRRDARRLRLGYVGRLDDREKRARDLVGLVKELPRDVAWELHIAGDGPDRDPILSALSEAAAEGRVVYHGLLTRAELYGDLYPQLQALLIFSPAEGGPIAAWEAMAHGVVPVSSDFAGRREEGVLRHGENCLIFPVGDMALAAQAVRRLLEPGLLSRLSTAAAALPEPYTEEGFGRAWHTQLAAVASAPARVGRVALPRLVSSGRLGRLPIPDRVAWVARRLARRRHEHADSGGEWPHSYGGTP